MREHNLIMQLGQILNCEIEQLSVSITHFNQANDIDLNVMSTGQYIYMNENSYVITKKSGQDISCLCLLQKKLTNSEAQLVKLLISPDEQEDLINTSFNNQFEHQVIKFGKWLDDKVESKQHQLVVPDELVIERQLYNEMIPVLLATDSHSAQSSTYQELDKLIKSFLSEDVLVVPLSLGEWLILAPVTILKDDEFVDEEEQDSIELSISNLAYGLQELLANEWIWESHLAISYPLIPVKSIVSKTIALRETMLIGRKFHLGTNIHLQWDLQLERLLHMIPEGDREKYIEQSFKKTELFVESEMMNTLETFFSLDCNVSETAKKLYIHRNTLLYRLDKLKQETGLDVRLFRDAVLVKIILLLYKVTKTN